MTTDKTKRAGWLPRLWRRRDDDALLPLYNAVVARGRAAHWYLDGAVPDTVEGRFDMIATVLAFVLLRLERDPAGAEPAARITERFIDDMDGQLRQIGIGDLVVGKQVGKMMALLGGRMGAYRDGLTDGSLEDALVRNLYRGDAPPPPALGHVAEALRAFHAALEDMPVDRLVEGDLP